MKHRETIVHVMIGTILAGMLAFVLGCQKSTSSADGNFIIFDPPGSAITGRSVVVWTVTNSNDSAFFFPLEWGVSDPSLGTIISAEGVTAVYESTGKKGNNVITVEDQGDSEGTTVVVQL